ncbi:MAG: hypothetical protein MUE81_18275 [Thermoflexibacter sp.]|nr:hypothetical protein [Thermoflexibacter sp.]
MCKNNHPNPSPSPKEKGAKIQIYSKSFPKGGAMQLKDLDRGERTI